MMEYWTRRPHHMTIYLTPSGWQCATTGLPSPGLDLGSE
jgi:hypothetical protein